MPICESSEWNRMDATLQLAIEAMIEEKLSSLYVRIAKLEETIHELQKIIPRKFLNST
jgi:hypothetical protein